MRHQLQVSEETPIDPELRFDFAVTDRVSQKPPRRNEKERDSKELRERDIIPIQFNTDPPFPTIVLNGLHLKISCEGTVRARPRVYFGTP